MRCPIASCTLSISKINPDQPHHYMTTIILLEFEPLTETGLLLITCHLPYHLTTSMVAPLPSGTFPRLGVQY